MIGALIRDSVVSGALLVPQGGHRALGTVGEGARAPGIAVPLAAEGGEADSLPGLETLGAAGAGAGRPGGPRGPGARGQDHGVYGTGGGNRNHPIQPQHPAQQPRELKLSIVVNV